MEKEYLSSTNYLEKWASWQKMLMCTWKQEQSLSAERTIGEKKLKLKSFT